MIHTEYDPHIILLLKTLGLCRCRSLWPNVHNGHQTGCWLFEDSHWGDPFWSILTSSSPRHGSRHSSVNRWPKTAKRNIRPRYRNSTTNSTNIITHTYPTSSRWGHLYAGPSRMHSDIMSNSGLCNELWLDINHKSKFVCNSGLSTSCLFYWFSTGSTGLTTCLLLISSLYCPLCGQAAMDWTTQQTVACWLIDKWQLVKIAINKPS